MLPRISAALFVAACIIFCGQRTVLAQWAPVADGTELLRQSAPGNSITYLRVSLDHFNVRVATPRVPKFGNAAQPSEYGTTPERSPRGMFLDDYIARYNALAAISAGYVETFSPPTPLGQIKSDGVIVGKSHSSWATEGSFCSDKGRASIEIATNPLNQDYRDCIQVGPILLLKGAVPTGLPSSSASGPDYDRMIKGQVGHAVVCIDKSGRILLALARPVALPTLVMDLQKSPIDCLDAVRLQPGGMRVNSDLFGVDRYLHPSALLVIKRTD